MPMHGRSPVAWRTAVGAVLFVLLFPHFALGASPGDKRWSAAFSAEVAPVSARPTGEVLAAWAELAAGRPGPVSVSWDAHTGSPRALFGRIAEAAAVSPEAAARQFLSENAALFRIPTSPRELSLTSSVESPMGRHVAFKQVYGDVPVAGAGVSVHFNAAGEIVAVGNTAVPGLALSNVRPRISAHAAARIARSAVPEGDAGDEFGTRSVRLTVYTGGPEPVLAWEVTMAVGAPTWRSYVDARSGELVGSPEDINRYVDGTGQVFRVNAVVATQDNTLRDQNDSATAVPLSAYSIVTLHGLDGLGHLDGTYASSDRTKKRASSSTNTFIFERDDDGFSETMGYYYIDYAERYIQSLGFSNVNNRQQVFSVNRFKQDNSFYSPQKKDITYGLGGVDDAEDAEVIWHEYGHSIQDNQVPGFGSSHEAGSMGEGFGDYWAGSLGAQLSGGFQDTCIADWDATSYSSSNPPCLRRLDGTKHYPESLDGEVHDDGEIWSAALWQIRGAIGPTKADTVVLQAHFLLAPTASFNDGANAIVTAAINLGFTTNEVNTIRSILAARGFTVTV